MGQVTQWYQATVVATHPDLPEKLKPGQRVAVSMAPIGVRIWAQVTDQWGWTYERPEVVTPEVAKATLKTERVDGHPVPAEPGIEIKWSWFFSGGS